MFDLALLSLHPLQRLCSVEKKRPFITFGHIEMAGFNFGHKLNNMKVVTILDEKEKD